MRKIKCHIYKETWYDGTYAWTMAVKKGGVRCSKETELGSDVQLERNCQSCDTHHLFVGTLLLG